MNPPQPPQQARDVVVWKVTRMVRDAGRVTPEVRRVFEESRISGATFREAVTKGLLERRKLCGPPDATVLVIVLEAGGAVTVCRGCAAKVLLEDRESGEAAPADAVCQDPDHPPLPEDEEDRLVGFLDAWPARR